MKEIYYIFEKDDLLKQESNFYMLYDYKEALEKFIELKNDFLENCEYIMDVLTTEVVGLGHICITDGEDEYNLILAKSI